MARLIGDPPPFSLEENLLDRCNEIDSHPCCFYNISKIQMHPSENAPDKFLARTLDYWDSAALTPHHTHVCGTSSRSVTSSGLRCFAMGSGDVHARTTSSAAVIVAMRSSPGSTLSRVSARVRR